MLIDVDTSEGRRKVRVCDYCQTVCIPSGRFCSGRCARQHQEREQWERERKAKEKNALDANNRAG